MSLPLVLLVVAAAGLVVAIPLIVIGLRGRRVGDHSHCRACGFDLHGLDPSVTPRCPECGAMLGGRPAGRWKLEAIRVGRHERRPRLFLWGGVLGLPSAAWLMLLAVAHGGSAQLYEYTPERILDWETRAGGIVAQRATNELSRRVSLGSLSASREQALVTRFLADQADFSRPWAHEKGDFIGHVQLAARLKPADWERYTYQAVSPALTVRSLVRFQGPVTFSVKSDLARFGTAAGPYFSSKSSNWGVAFWVVAQNSAGAVYTLGGDRQEGLASRVGADSPSGFLSKLDIDLKRDQAAASIGTAPVTRYGILIEEGVANNPPAVHPLPAWPAHVVPLTIAAPGTPTVTARSDPRMRDLVSATVHLKLTPSERYPTTVPANAIGVHRQRTDRGLVEHLDVNLVRETSTPWPLPTAWVMWVRIAGKEIKVGDTGFGADARTAWNNRDLPAPDPDRVFHVDAVDVILRPDVDVAEESVGVTEYWDGEIEFKNVPLIRREPLGGE